MSSISIPSETGAPVRLSLLERTARRLVLKGLQSMRRGRLTIRLPEGSQVEIGDGALPAGAGTSGTAAIRVIDERFFRRCCLYGDIGFAESFIDGDWTTDDIEAVISWFILNAESSPSQSASRSSHPALNVLEKINRLSRAFQSNTKSGSRRNIRAHYDLSNEFFSLFLDRSMTYSSGYFESEEMTLEEAQEAKYDRLCRKLQLSPGERVLEIGGGWGAFSRHAASRYDCHVTSLTISHRQYEHAAAKLKESGLEARVDLRLLDYRDIEGTFDKIVSIEMLEAVGHEHLPVFFGACDRLLAPHGLLGLQFITCPDARYEKLRHGVDFIQKHIFPGSQILSIAAVNDAINRTGDLFLHHLEDLGSSYVRTLRKWHEAFNERLDQVRGLGFDDAFIRKWNYYLTYCCAAFAMRHNSVVQAVYTRPNNLTLRGVQ